MSEPLRTCIGCRTRDTQRAMVRIIRSGGGDGHLPNIHVDGDRRLPGRGAWLHPSEECLAKTIRRDGLARAFKTMIEAPEAQAFAELFRRYLDGVESTTNPV